MKYLLGALGSGLFIALIYFGSEIKQHFGKRYANAEREIFENSKPFIHGSTDAHPINQPKVELV